MSESSSGFWKVPIFNKNKKVRKNDPSNQVNPDFFKNLGYNSINIDGKDYLVPAGITSKDDLISLLDLWRPNINWNVDREVKRVKLYELADKLDIDSSEVHLTYDTYADEVFAVGSVDNPIDIEVSDPLVREKLLNILIKNNIFSSYWSLCRDLLKYGDIGIYIHVSNDYSKPIEDRVSLLPLLPKEWTVLVGDDLFKLPVGYQVNNPYVGTSYSVGTATNKIIPLQNFCQFTIPSTASRPYGRSLTEGIVQAADHLNIMESLLVLSRQSRVERTIVKVPLTGAGNPAAMAQQLNMVRSQLRNSIFQNSNGDTRTVNKVPALQEMVFMPSNAGWDMSRLPSSIDLSTIDDVNYVREKYLIASRLPKGYLASDTTTDRGGTLAAQDLKFNRALDPYQRAFTKSLSDLCIRICYFIIQSLSDEEYDRSQVLNVKVKLKKSPQIAISVLEQYKQVIDLVTSMMSELDLKLDKSLFRKLLLKLGVPVDIADLLSVAKVNDEGFDSNEVSIDTIHGDNFDTTIIDSVTEKVGGFKSTNSYLQYTSQLTKSQSTLFETNQLEVSKGSTSQVITEAIKRVKSSN